MPVGSTASPMSTVVVGCAIVGLARFCGTGLATEVTEVRRRVRIERQEGTDFNPPSYMIRSLVGADVGRGGF